MVAPGPVAILGPAPRPAPRVVAAPGDEGALALTLLAQPAEELQRVLLAVRQGRASRTLVAELVAEPSERLRLGEAFDALVRPAHVDGRIYRVTADDLVPAVEQFLPLDPDDSKSAPPTRSGVYPAGIK
jgi:hypothetical protein